MNQIWNDHYDFGCVSLSRHVQFQFPKSTKPLMFFWREIRFCFRLCRHFSPQCDSHGRSNQLTQSSATDSPGCSSIFNFLTRLWFFLSHTSLSDHSHIRINDLSKEAILQCINESDLRFLKVTWSKNHTILKYLISIFYNSLWIFHFQIDLSQWL